MVQGKIRKKKKKNTKKTCNRTLRESATRETNGAGAKGGEKRVPKGRPKVGKTVEIRGCWWVKRFGGQTPEAKVGGERNSG